MVCARVAIDKLLWRCTLRKMMNFTCVLVPRNTSVWLVWLCHRQIRMRRMERVQAIVGCMLPSSTKWIRWLWEFATERVRTTTGKVHLATMAIHLPGSLGRTPEQFVYCGNVWKTEMEMCKWCQALQRPSKKDKQKGANALRQSARQNGKGDITFQFHK